MFRLAAEVRRAQPCDLPALLALFAAAEVSQAAGGAEAEAIWTETLTTPGVTIFVAAVEERIVATALLVTAPNLLRGGRRHGFLENVVAHPDERGRGYGRAVVAAALAEARARGCHHVLLQTGRADARVHRFYAAAGFRAGVRIAYVAAGEASAGTACPQGTPGES